MSTPETTAGKLLLMAGLRFGSGRRLADYPEMILAIEAEAGAAALLRDDDMQPTARSEAQGDVAAQQDWAKLAVDGLVDRRLYFTDPVYHAIAFRLRATEPEGTGREDA